MFISKSSKLLAVLGIWSLFLVFFAGESLAAAPEWFGGFPKVVQNDVLLQWKPVKGAEQYKVYKSEQKDSGLKLLATVQTNRHIDKGLSAGKTVYYYVAPVVGGKEGERSSAGVISTAKEKAFVALKTPKLTGGHAKQISGGKYVVGLRWEEAGGTDLIGVNVYRSEKKGRDYAMVGSSSSDTFEDADVKPGETYYYTVTAVDSQFKESKRSNEISVSVPAPVAAKAAEPKVAAKVVPTLMRPAKLLFRIPREENKQSDPFVPENAQQVAVDEAVGHIYVTSYGYGGILVYNLDGEFQFGVRKDGISGDQKFVAPTGIAVGQNGNIYVSALEQEVYVYSFSGKPVDVLKVEKEHMPNFRGYNPNIFGIAIEENNIYFTDPNMNGFHAFRLKGFKNLFNSYAPILKDKTKDGIYYNGPSYIVVTDEGDIAFMDPGYARVVLYGPDGKFKRYISKPGTGAGELSFPAGIAKGNKGEILVANAMDPNIQAFSAGGDFLYALSNEKVNGPLTIYSTHGIFVDKKNRLYVAEGTMNRVSVFQMEDRTVEVTPR